MSTTDLLVEYLVIGAFSDIWIVLMLLAVAPLNSTTLASVVDSVDKTAAIIIIPFLAITYVLGGIINFTASILFKKIQTKFRNRIFQDAGTSYYQARGLLYQDASPDVMSRFRSDGHIIRIARSSILNFICLASVLMLHIKNYTLPTIAGLAICILLALLSFFLWKDRYESNYSQMLGTYKVLQEKYEKGQASLDKREVDSSEMEETEQKNTANSRRESVFSIFNVQCKK